MDHLAGHFVGGWVISFVELALRLEDLGSRDDEARANRPLEMVLLVEEKKPGQAWK